MRSSGAVARLKMKNSMPFGHNCPQLVATVSVCAQFNVHTFYHEIVHCVEASYFSLSISVTTEDAAGDMYQKIH